MKILIPSVKEIDISAEIGSPEFAQVVSNSGGYSSVKFKPDDTEIEAIINKISFFGTEAIQMRQVLTKVAKLDQKQLTIVLKWLKVWKYLKDNLFKLKINNFINCGLKESLIFNIFDELMNQNSGSFVELFRNWLNNSKSSICTGKEIINPVF